MIGPSKRFEPTEILRILDHHRVAFVLIGGLAGNVHGAALDTFDLDICYARDPGNLERLSKALTKIGVELRGADPGLPFRPDPRTLRNGLNFTFTTRYGAFDCLGEASRLKYEDLAPNASPGDLGGYEVPVASLDDLIRMKRAAGRAKDLVAVAHLERLREFREARGLFGLAEPRARRERQGRHGREPSTSRQKRPTRQ